MKKVFRVRILPDSCFLKNQPGTRFYLSREQLVTWLLPDAFSYTIVNIEEPADVCLCSVRLPSHRLLRANELNILISIENCIQWKSWFPHYQIYGDFGDPMVSIYIYNHLDEMIIQSPSFLALPMIYFRIRYFQLLENIWQDSIPFEQKKFLLVINKSGLDPNLPLIVRFFSSLGLVDHISLYDEQIKNTSCYHSPELLNVFSKYKFILVNENSRCPGYVTEKIFNVFLAKSIPIYHGAPDIERYFCKDAFLHFDPTQDPNNFLQRFHQINTNESAYQEMVQSPKIREAFQNEDFYTNYTKFFFNFLSKKKKQT